MENMATVSLNVLRRAIETRDGAALGGCYADDAELRIIDSANPPSQPREIKGHAAIAAYFDDVCGRTMTHKVENGIETADRMAFTQRCRYPDGKGVFCSTTIELAGGKIARQVVVQAWDE
jgi:ketosteroid isomerase-like protein